MIAATRLCTATIASAAAAVAAVIRVVVVVVMMVVIAFGISSPHLLAHL